MSTVRIQVRRGTASEWTAANPILAAGEMGVETNTNKFKFGNGTDAWTILSYAAADAAGISEISQDAINTALSMGSGLTKTYDDGANTITITVDTDVIATKSFATSEATSKANAAQTAAATDATNKANAAQTAAEDYTDAAVGSVNNSLADYILVADRAAANGVASLNGLGKLPESQLQLTGLTGSISTSGSVSAEDITVAGNLVVNGTTTTLNTQSYTVADPMIYIGEDNHSNQLDLGFVAGHDDGTYNHTGLVRDASDGKWKLFKGVTDEPTTTVNFAQATLDNISVGDLDAAKVTTAWLQATGTVELPSSVITEANITSSAVTANKIAVDSIDSSKLKSNSVVTAKIADSAVTAAKVALDAITETKIADSSVTTAKIANTAINAAKLADSAVTEIKILNEAVSTSKVASAAITETKIANDAVSTIKIADSAVTVAKIADSAITNAKISASAAIAQSKIDGLGAALDLLAPKAAPTFTGTVTLPATTSIGTVSSTELGYVDGVTSAIQTQLDAKATSATVTSHTSATTNVHGIADTAALATKTYVDNAGSALQTNIDAKAPIASPTFTGTVAGITKSMVGLANVDNTTDAAKPISTATQTALDLKANLAGPTFTGTVSAANLTLSGNLTVNGTTTTVSSTNLEITDPLIYIGTGNSANANDLGIVGHFNDGTYQHTGLARDASDGKWKLFSGVTVEPSGTVDFTTWTKDTLVTGPIEATTVTPSAGVVFSDGTQTKIGVPSLTTIGTAIAANYNLSTGGLALRDQLIPVSGTYTITVPANATTAYPVGTSISFYQSAGADAAFAEAAGVTILRTPGLKLRALSSSATLTKVATDTWLLAGDLKA